MRSFINSITLSESWTTGNPFLNVGSGSVWFLLDSPEDIESIATTLKIRDRARLTSPAYLLVHDNSPVMLATVDPHTGHVNQAFLQGGVLADAGWSRYTQALEQKLMGNEDLDEEDAVPMMAEDEVVGSVVPGTRKPQGFLRVNAVMHQIAQSPAPQTEDDATRLIARINNLCDAVEEFADRRAKEGQHGLSLELRKAASDARAMFPRGDENAIMDNPHTPQNCRQAIEELRDALYTAGIMVEGDKEAPPGEEQILDEAYGDFDGCSEEVRQIAKDIHNCGAVPIIYSGRAMYGRKCVGFTAEYRFEIEDIVAQLVQRSDLGEQLAGPDIDQMGRGFVAYWPWLKVE